MLRLCSHRLFCTNRRLFSSAVVNAAQVGKVTKLQVSMIKDRTFTTSPSNPTSTSSVPVLSDPAKLPLPEYEWLHIEDFMNEWYSGNDTLHITHRSDPESGAFRGVSFFNKAHEWQGAFRWAECLRKERPSVWLHWLGKDPIELSTTMPKPDKNGYYTWSMTLTKRQFVAYCNNELIGVRDNMLYQYKNVDKLWFPDYEALGGKYMIEGPNTAYSGIHTYRDVPLFQTVREGLRLFRERKALVDSEHALEQSWRHK